ncbi:ankyrin [Acrasis kona]|uniref:Ankyrin n=1 Tax=Acrasis kona TaxID=1008807 RepID=A0AAW2ZMK5_9EUKA
MFRRPVSFLNNILSLIAPPIPTDELNTPRDNLSQTPTEEQVIEHQPVQKPIERSRSISENLVDQYTDRDLSSRSTTTIDSQRSSLLEDLFPSSRTPVKIQSIDMDTLLRPTGGRRKSYLRHSDVPKRPPRAKRTIPDDVYDSKNSSARSQQRSSERDIKDSSSGRNTPSRATSPQSKTIPDSKIDKTQVSQSSAAALGLAILQRTRSGELSNGPVEHVIKNLVTQHVDTSPNNISTPPKNEDQFGQQLSLKLDRLNGFSTDDSGSSERDTSVVPSLKINSKEPTSDAEFLDIVSKNGRNVVVVVEDILEEDPINIDFADRNGLTALHKSTQNGNPPLVKVLLEAGADCDIAAHNGYTALHWAAQGGHLEIVKMLVLYVKDIDASDIVWTPLLLAANNGFVDIVRVLAENKANLERRTDTGLTALLLATRSFMSDVVQVLCEFGADMEATIIGDETGWTCLHWVSHIGNLQLVELFCDFGAHVNAQTSEEGYTALMIACMGNNKDIVDLLLNSGANSRKRSKEGLTASEYCLRKGYTELNKLIERVSNDVIEVLYDTLDDAKVTIKNLDAKDKKTTAQIADLEKTKKEQVEKINKLEHENDQLLSDLEAFRDTIVQLRRYIEQNHNK